MEWEKESTIRLRPYHRFRHPPACHLRLGYVGLLRLFFVRQRPPHYDPFVYHPSAYFNRTGIHALELARIFFGKIIFLKSIRVASEGVLHATSSGGGAHLHFEIEIETQRIMAFWQRGKRLRVDSFWTAFTRDDVPPRWTREEGWTRFGTVMVLMRVAEGESEKINNTTLHITSYVQKRL